MKWKIYSLSREETEYMRKNLKTKTAGYYSCILLALSLFLSIKLQSVFGILGSLFFLIEIFSKESRLNFIKKLDKKILYGMLVFVVTPYIIATINGGIGTRLDMDDYAKFLLFFPLSFFLNTGEKIFNFLKAILTSATISLLITLGIFVKDYNLWKNPQGFVYDRIYFELPTQDFANIMSMILLFLIIVKGAFFTDLSVKPDIYPHAFKRGFLEGYQTMDTIASIAYAGIILTAIKSGRTLSQKQEFSFLIKSGLVAIVSLALIYGGFAFVGAKMHSVLSTQDKIELLVRTTSYLLGSYGNLVLAVCVAGACLTTAIGLVATVGEFFSSITSFKYEKIVIFTVLISFALSVLGVESIIRISVPILIFIYPITISLILLNLFGKYIKNDYVYKGVVFFTGIVGLIESLDSLGIENYYTKSVLEILPFSDYGLTWLFPGLIGYILCSLIFRRTEKKED